MQINKLYLSSLFVLLSTGIAVAGELQQTGIECKIFNLSLSLIKEMQNPYTGLFLVEATKNNTPHKAALVSFDKKSASTIAAQIMNTHLESPCDGSCANTIEESIQKQIKTFFSLDDEYK